MAEYPRTVLEFRDWFADDAACRDYLVRLRWPEGFRCPKCRGADHWVTARGLRHCRGCGRQTSVTAGTLFADTHLPLRLWFEALWHVTSQKSGASALGLQRVLGLGSYRTAWNLLHKLRRAMVRPGRERLQGIIEVDEIFIGGPRPGKRGRGAHGKVLVVVAAQQAAKGIGRIRLTRVADASARSQEPAITAAIEASRVTRTLPCRSRRPRHVLRDARRVRRKCGAYIWCTGRRLHRRWDRAAHSRSSSRIRIPVALRAEGAFSGVSRSNSVAGDCASRSHFSWIDGAFGYDRSLQVIVSNVLECMLI
jgi:hypothetical protein